jgi:hypothetical protein
METAEKDKKALTVGELIQDQHFIDRVNKNLTKLIGSRENRPDPKPGHRYIRDWYDRMTEAGQVTPEFFLENILAIWGKKSNLSSSIRSVIKYVCDISAHETLTHYHEESKTV